MTVLVIAAHPDDEVLGCGGTIARHARSGEPVDIVFLSDGETSRPGATAADAERRQRAALAAAQALGANPPVFLGFADNALDTTGRLTVAQAVERATARMRPTVVYTHHAGDLNVDHRITAAAALTAFRPQPGSSVRAIYGFEVLSSTHWAGPQDGFNPVRFVDISADLAAKRRALECYASEMRAAPHARSMEAVEHLAGFRGMAHGLAAAEAFTVLREIVAPLKPLVAIVGCGSIGGRYGRLLAASGHGLVLQDHEAARARELAAATGADVAEALEGVVAARPHLAIVATPPDRHAGPAVRLIEAGIPTLVEKPLAHDMADASRILAAAEAGAAPAFCVCNLRFHPPVAALKPALPAIGEPVWARAHFGHRLSQMRPAGTAVFAAHASAGGGVVMDCIHEFDYLQALFGPLTLVGSTVKSIGPDGIDAEDWALVRLEAAGGIPVVLELDFIARRKTRGCEIVGTEGSLIWHSTGRAPEICRVWIARRDGEEEIMSALDGPDEYSAMLAAVLDEVLPAGMPRLLPRQGRQPLQTIAQAHRSLALALAARRGYP